METKTRAHWGRFLKDVMICSLGAYGGPEAHFGVFTDQMVVKKHYLTEEELVELIALTGILPGPSSTQTITAIGHKMGGPVLAFLTLLVWALPAIIIMTFLSFLYFFLSKTQFNPNILIYIRPLAVGFILVAGYRIGKKVMKDRLTIVLFLFSLGVTLFIQSALLFPLLLLMGGVTSVIVSKERQLWHRLELKPTWIYLISFLGFALLVMGLNAFFPNRIFHLLEMFYRFGYLVIGGGQVVIPYMINDLVLVNGILTMDEFLTGFGIVQGIPGPMFSFAAYAGGLASKDLGIIGQILGALVSGIAIFLPGTLLIFFIYPIWTRIKTIKAIRIAIAGITAVAGGFIGATGVRLLILGGWKWDILVVMGITVVLLLIKKLPAPVLVLMTLLLGFLIYG